MQFILETRDHYAHTTYIVFDQLQYREYILYAFWIIIYNIINCSCKHHFTHTLYIYIYICILFISHILYTFVFQSLL